MNKKNFVFTNLYFSKFLEPYTEYQIHINAYGKGKLTSENSDVITQSTDVDPPGPPVIVNATCVPGTSGTSIFLQWAPPKNYYKSIDEYVIFVSKGTNEVKNYTISQPKDNFNLSVCELCSIK